MEAAVRCNRTKGSREDKKIPVRALQKIMRTIVARLIQLETQLFKELGNATGKLDGAVKNLLNHAELEKSLSRPKFKLKQSDCQGSEESALEQRLSGMEKLLRFIQYRGSRR